MSDTRLYFGCLVGGATPRDVKQRDPMFQKIYEIIPAVDFIDIRLDFLQVNNVAAGDSVAVIDELTGKKLFIGEAKSAAVAVDMEHADSRSLRVAINGRDILPFAVSYDFTGPVDDVVMIRTRDFRIGWEG